jgi:MFS family permease
MMAGYLSIATPSNISLLYAARGVRGFGDGFAIIILPAYLTAIGYDPVQIGFVATASLLGTALLTLAIGTIAARYDLRTLLLLGACLMAGTGLAFPNVEQFTFVALVAFVGTVNPSTGDLGVLVPIEHAMLAHGVADQERTRTFARYSRSSGRGGAGFPGADRHRHAERIQAYVLRLRGVGGPERGTL